MWVLAVTLMVAEFLLFDRMTSRHHASVYPRWNDQIQYLSEAYTAYERAQSEGFFSSAKTALTKTALQGTLHDVAALVVFTVTGSPSRSAALSLNMLVFLVWQAALLFTVHRLTGSRVLGWMAFGLVLCVAWPWSGEAGSAVDFRLDHAAMCLMGVAACCAALSDGFRHRGWSVAFGVAVAITLLERFLTGAYFAAIFVTFAIWAATGRERWRRLGHLVLAGAIATAVALPAFWHSREAIYNYYWVGHVSGAESTARFRGLDLWNSVQFIFANLGRMHLGAQFGWAVAVLTAMVAVLWVWGPRRESAHSRRAWMFSALIFSLLPAAVLTLHRQKSEYVLGVLVGGIVLLVPALWACAWDRIAFENAAPLRRRLALAPAMLALGIGGWFYVNRQIHPVQADLASVRKINEVADRIFESARRNQIKNPYIAIDQVVDYFDAQILQVICYERKKIWVPFVIQLPNSILEDTDEVMLYRLKLCHFVVLTDQMDGPGHWPYDKQMRRLYPQLKAWCEANLERVETFRVFGRQLSLYQRNAP
ncbi:MAG: hypothetical protein C0518_00495 [Opitutus sp.]|nr:hypothetical protein [Opitutus sp.]